MTADQDPSLAIDAAGHAYIAYERASQSPDRTSIYYATNASGSWVVTQRTTGAPHDLGPRIALDAAGKPRIAFLREGSGVRLQAFTGSSWTSKTVSSGADDADPSIAIDAAGRTHVLFAAGGTHYEVCGQPLCSAHPGLRWWNDAPGAGSARRVTDFGDDVSPSLVRGLDGSLSAAFVNTQWRLAEIRLTRPLARVSAPVVHLEGPGAKLDPGRASLVVTFSGTGAALYRLQDSADGGPYATIGPVKASTSRIVSMGPSASTTHRFRVIPYDAFEVQGVAAYGPTLRVSSKSEKPSAKLQYMGSWTRMADAGFLGTHARIATSGAARATYAFTGREVAWVAAKGRHAGPGRRLRRRRPARHRRPRGREDPGPPGRVPGDVVGCGLAHDPGPPAGRRPSDPRRVRGAALGARRSGGCPLRHVLAHLVLGAAVVHRAPPSAPVLAQVQEVEPAVRAALHPVERAVREELRRRVDDRPQGSPEVVVCPAPVVGVVAGDQLRVRQRFGLVALQPGDGCGRGVPAGRDRIEEPVQVVARREHALVDLASFVGMPA